MKKQTVTTDLLDYFVGTEVTILSNIQETQYDEENNPISGMIGYRGVLIDFDANWILMGIIESGEPVPNILLKREAVMGIQLLREIQQDTLPDSISGEMN